MKITVNGETHEIPENLTVATLLAHLKLPPERVAIERNREILPRGRWQETTVQLGDTYEIVHLVGGG